MPTIVYSLVAAAAALAAVFVFLRFFDVLAGGWGHFKRKAVLDVIHRDARATAQYYGLRFLGACIVVGLVVGAVRLSL